MNIMDFLCKDAITLDHELLKESKKIKKTDEIIDVVLERENLGSTGVGHGVAIPHGKTDVLSEQVGVLGISKKGIEFNSLDGEPVYIIFLLVGPVEVTGQHLKALSRISRLFKDKFLRQAIKDAQTKEDVVKIIQQEDAY